MLMPGNCTGLLLLVGLCLGSSCSSNFDRSSSCKSDVLLEDRLLAKLPPGVGEGYTEYLFSPDGRKAAYVIRKGLPDDPEASARVVVDGEPGPEASWIGAMRIVDYQGMPTFSPDGDTIAYAARRGPWDRAKWIVVVGKQAGEEFDDVEDPFFSPVGRHVAYLATVGKKRFLVVDGRKVGLEYDSVFGPTFSPDGSLIAYVARRGGTPDDDGIVTGGRAFVVVGSHEGPSFDAVTAPVFHPDGKSVAYGAEQDGKWSVISGDQRGKAYEHVSGIAYSRDGKRIAYGALQDGKWSIVVDGRRDGASFDWVGEPLFSPDGSRVAYQAIRKGRSAGFGLVLGNRCVVIGDQAGEDCEFISDVTFSADGKTLSYLMHDGNRWFVVAGAKKLGGEFDSVSLFANGPDGSNIAFVGYKKNACFVVAGEHQSEVWDNIRSLVASSDGKNIAFGARRGDELWWKVLNLR